MFCLFDTHCHLVDIPSSTRSSLTIQDATLSILAVSKTANDWLPTLQLAESNDIVYPALGIHPWYLSGSRWETDIEQLTGFIRSHQNLKVLGEIGLDFSIRYKDSISQQIKCLGLQLEIAKKNELALSIHCHKAFDQLQTMLIDAEFPKGVLHGFSGSFEQARLFVQQGYKLGIGPLLLNLNAKKLIRVVEKVPLQNLVLESDAPYAVQGSNLSHVQRLIAIAQRIAQIKQIPLEEVVKTTYDSAKNILG